MSSAISGSLNVAIPQPQSSFEVDKTKRDGVKKPGLALNQPQNNGGSPANAVPADAQVPAKIQAQALEQARQAEAASKEANKIPLGEAVQSLNNYVNSEMRTLNFSVDDESGKAVVKVVDFETREIIRQIPEEEALKMAAAIRKMQDDNGASTGGSATGLMIDNKV
jgi:flagellar protein FlaG